MSKTVLFLIGSYLLLVCVLPAVLSAVVSYRAVPVGRQCPECRAETIPLLHRWLKAASRLNPVAVVQRRWCLRCGWEGTVRLPRRAARHTLAGVPREHPTHTLDLRSLTVDGRPWRVLLQCWQRTGMFYGRLVFMAPSGRLWLDGVEAFTGATRREIVGQALSLSDGLLTNRLRRLVGDA